MPLGDVRLGHSFLEPEPSQQHPGFAQCIRLLMVRANKLLRISEAAEIARASKDTVRYWVKTGKLPSVKPGRSRLIEASELAVFLRRNARGYEVSQ